MRKIAFGGLALLRRVAWLKPCAYVGKIKHSGGRRWASQIMVTGITICYS
jgi:hypothetical protein